LRIRKLGDWYSLCTNFYLRLLRKNKMLLRGKAETIHSSTNKNGLLRRFASCNDGWKVGSLNQVGRIAILFIRLYQLFLSPFLGFYKCRFTPSCSQYMIEAISKKGLLKGFLLGISRLSKCHPFSKKIGFDHCD